MELIRVFTAIISILMVFSGCHENSIKDGIKYRGYFIDGNIKISDKDTVFDGPIVYHDSLGKRMITENYANNKKEGVVIFYNDNGTINQVLNYSSDSLNGPVQINDTTGRLVEELNYFHDIQIGPYKTVDNDTLKKFGFLSFEGANLYTVDKDSSGHVVESTELLHYVADYFKVDKNTSVDSCHVDPPFLGVDPPAKQVINARAI